MAETLYCIYRIACTVTGKCYVGQTCDKRRRYSSHFSGLRKGNHPNKRLQDAYDYYGRDSFIWEVIQDGISHERVNDCETYWIEHYDSFSNGYNRVPTALGRRRISEADQFLIDQSAAIDTECAILREQKICLEEEIDTFTNMYRDVRIENIRLEALLKRCQEELAGARGQLALLQEQKIRLEEEREQLQNGNALLRYKLTEERDNQV